MSTVNSETPPDLQATLEGAESSTASNPANDDFRISEIILQILSRLTVYQSLPESSSLVLAVRDDVTMMDACCLFLPSSTTTNHFTLSSTVIEVLRTSCASFVQGCVPESPETRSKNLLKFSKDRFESDSLFSKALEDEATRVTSAVAADLEAVHPVGDFLSVFDLFHFVSHLLTRDPATNLVHADITVAQWLEMKRSTANGHHGELVDRGWRIFCERSVLVTRSALDMCPGISHHQIISGSSMNLSASNLLRSDSPMLFHDSVKRKGGSSLAAVSLLLARPWQQTLPITISSEKGVSCLFAYTTLAQLMAHVALNCSDKILEPFFRMPVSLDDIASVARANLNAIPVLDFDSATVADAIEVFATSLSAIVASREDGVFRLIITPEDVVEHVSTRMDRLLSGSEPPALSEVKLTDIVSIDDSVERPNVIYDSDFPLEFSSLLHKILLSKQNQVVIIVSESDIPVGLITVRDVWNYVMQGNSLVL